VALAIEDNLAVVNGGGFLRAVEPDRLKLSDAQDCAMRLSLTLEPTATYRYRVVEGEVDNQPYETLEIHFNQCLACLAAFRAQPKQPVWLTL
jgi:hypothetical protein